MNGKGFIVSGGIPVMFAPREHEEDRAKNFVADGDDGALVAASDEKRLELRLEHRRGTAGGMSEFAEQAADVGVALANLAGFALASGLVIARADADPGCEAICGAEGGHVGTDLDKQHGGADQVDAGNGLQQRQGVALGLELAEQASVKAYDTLLDLFDVLHQFVEDEAVAGRQIALQGIEQFLAAGLESATSSQSSKN